MRLSTFIALLVLQASIGHASLLAHFPFDSDFNDSSGNANHLTVASGTPSITSLAGERAFGGGALDVDSSTGTEEYLNLTNPISFGASDAWSVAFWIRRRPGTDFRSGMVIGDPSNNTDFIWTPDNSSQVQGVRFRSSSNSNANFGGFPDDGNFHHWAIIADGVGNVTAYRDQVSLGSVATTSSFSITSVAQAFNSTTQSMDGQIDELYIYDEAIDSSKVEELFLRNDEPAPPSSQPDRIRVFLIGGQSNAAGRADSANLPTSPINLQQPQEDVDFYEGSSLRTLRPGSEFGPEITLGRGLADGLGDGGDSRIAIIRYGVGGTSLKSDWKAGGDATKSGDGPRYVTFQQTVTNGLAALAAAHPGNSIEIEGMLWAQGEKDARNLDHAEYETNLIDLIADVRATYGADLPFVVMRLSSGQTNLPAAGLDGVRAAQTAVAEADPRTLLIDSDGFGLLADNLHFDALGQQQIGSASAGAFVSFFPFAPPGLVWLGSGEIAVTVDHAILGLPYTLQTNLDLQLAGWAHVESKLATGPLVNFNYTAPSGDRRRFFRVLRSAP